MKAHSADLLPYLPVMSDADPISVAVRFNDSINARDADGLHRMRSEDSAFVDAEQNVVSWRKNCLRAWQDFFAQ